MGIGPIPWGRIIEYAAYSGLDETIVVDGFVRIIREMDRGYLKWCAQEAERVRKYGPPVEPEKPRKR